MYFKNNGYIVTSIDPIKEFCKYGKSIGLDNVIQMSIEDIDYNNEFDAIWACASLLHLKSNQLVDVFNKCYKALKDNGVMYVSFINIINQTNFKIDKLWINSQDRLNRDVKWLNVLLEK